MNKPPRLPIPRALLCAAISLLAAPGAAHAVTFDTSSGDITQSAAITNEINLVKTGTGTLTLTAANSFAGEVAVNNGTLAINHSDALAGATPVIVSARAAIPATTFSSTMIGGALSVSGAGTTLSGVFLPAGQYTITGTSTITSVANPSQTYSLAGAPATNGILSLNTSVAGLDAVKVFGGTINGAGTLAANTLTMRNGTVSAAIVGASRVIVGEESASTIVVPSTDVGGSAVLSGNNTYSGGTTVYSGTLEARSANALGTGDITVKGTGGAPAYNTLSIPVSFTTPASGGTGSSSTLSSGTLQLGGSNTIVFATTTLSAGVGTMLGAGALNLSSASVVTASATLRLTQGSLTLAPSNGVVITSGTLNLSGSDTTTRTIPNTGTLAVNAEVVAPGSLVLDGGTITGTGSLNAASFELRAGTVGAKLTGSGTLTKSGEGTVVLSGANDHSGGTIVQAGRLAVDSAGALNGGSVLVSGGLLYVSAAQNLSRLDTTSTGQLGITAGETQVHAGTLAGNISIAAGSTLTIDGTARIVQPENGHPGNLVYGPNGAETLATSVLLVNGTLNLNAGTHRLGLLAGAGNILVDSSASYSFVASQFTGAISLVNGTTSNDRPAATGGTRFSGSVTAESNLTGSTNRTLTMRGDGEAIVISDWSGYDTINIRDGITFNLGQGEHHSVGTSILRIDAGATLKGLGTLTGSLVNNGVLSPGNSPGVIAVLGDFTNGSTGVVNIEIAGTTPGSEFDVVRYAGTATLNGGTLNLTLINGYRPTGPVALRILEDTAPTAGSTSVSGAFAAVNSPSGIYLSLVTDSDGILAKLSPTLAGTGVRLHDGLAKADAQAALQPTLFSTLATTLSSGGDAAAARALQALSPIGLTALPALSIDASLADTRTVANRADAHRRLVTDKSATWEAFVGYTGRFADTEGGASAPVFDSSVQGGHAGLEKAVTDNLVVGAMPAYARGKADLSAQAGSVTLERAGLSAYTGYVAGSTEALLGVRGSYLDYETRRTHALGSDKGATHGFDYGAFATVSHAVTLGDFAITPEATLGYTRTEISAFDESGTAAALHVKTIGQDSLRARIGSAFDWIPLRSADSSFAIGLAVGAEHELLDHDGEIVAAYAGGTSFTTESALGAESSVDVGPQLTWVFSKSNTIRAGYRYEYGFDDSTAHRLDLSYARRF